MNWMNGLCMLVGLAIGAEIMYCILKYRFDKVAMNIEKLHDDLRYALERNDRLMAYWQDAIKLNDEVIERLKAIDGKGAAEND